MGKLIDLRETLAKDFDEVFYLQQNSDISKAGLDPLNHFILFGWKEGRDPNREFSCASYLAAYPDVAAASVNPFWHYLVNRPDRTPPPPAHLSLPPSGPSHEETRAVEAEFDASYYLARYSDVASAAIDPLTHFMQEGWREGRDPNAHFSVRDYLDEYEDVRNIGINPFWHFIVAGRAEGRSPRKGLGHRYQTLREQPPFGEMISRAVEHGEAQQRPDQMRFSGAHLGALANAKGLHITFSHDDYTKNVGGVQICLARESAAIQALGLVHLHAFPRIPLPGVAVDRKVSLGILVNGVDSGVAASARLARVLSDVLSAKRLPVTVAIHSLLGHNAEEVVEVLSAAGVERIIFWLHDYASICAGFNLLRNNIEFCNAPPIDSAACLVCQYGSHRDTSVEAHAVLFSAFRVTVAAPSQYALNLWRESSALVAERCVVLPHCEITQRSPRKVKALDDGVTRIGFLGYPTAHKGWPVFRELSLSLSGARALSFVHLGRMRDPSVNLAFVPVSVTGEDPKAMARAVAESNLDYALIWSMWPETFCFAAYEALAGGAKVLTCSASGNVAALVRATGLGEVFSTEAQLQDFVASLNVERPIRSKRPNRHLTYSHMSADLLEDFRT